MKREEAWKHVIAVVNDLGETVINADAPGRAWMDRARIVVWITPTEHTMFGTLRVARAIAVLHRDASLRIDDRTAIQLAIEYSTARRGARPSEPKYVL